MQLRYQLKHPEARSPRRMNPTDAGIDLHAAQVLKDTSLELWFDTGVAVEIPEGHFGLVTARSSISRLGLMLANGVGIIDSEYRGTIQVRFRRTPVYNGAQEVRDDYQVGDRIAQLIIVPFTLVNLEAAASLIDTERGEGGFGSTGT